MPPASRYRPDSPSDYSHRFHVGNVGDVWKHCALVELLHRVAAASPRVGYVETHAGEGAYRLGATGEWTEGIGRLWRDAQPPTTGESALGRYLGVCRRLGRGAERIEEYPGSPAIAQQILGPDARLDLFEQDEAAFARLRARVGEDRRVHAVRDDGWSGLGPALRAAESARGTAVALIDPPYSQKPEWGLAADALVAAAGVTERAHLMLWYPVKSLTRPNAMRARLEAAGVAGALVEVVTMPLDSKRHRLNGSGVLLVRPPGGILPALASAAAELGERCAVRHGTWSTRSVAWDPGPFVAQGR